MGAVAPKTKQTRVNINHPRYQHIIQGVGTTIALPSEQCYTALLRFTLFVL